MSKTINLPAIGEDSAWSLSVKLFGQPILLPHESRAQYRRQFESFAGDLQPRDSIELMLVRDITDLWFDISRQREAKVVLMTPSTNPVPSGLKKYLPREAATEGGRCASMTSTRIKDLALLDHMIAVAQQRKYHLLDFLYRLRDIRAKAAQEAGELPVVDGEFAELAPINDAAILEVR